MKRKPEFKKNKANSNAIKKKDVSIDIILEIFKLLDLEPPEIQQKNSSNCCNTSLNDNIEKDSTKSIIKQNNSSKSESDINNNYYIHSQKIEKTGLVDKNFF